MINKSSFQSLPRKYKLRIITGQKLQNQESKCRKNIDPYVRVNFAGKEQDRYQFETEWIPNNAFNPHWDETIEVIVHNPEVTMIRFSVWNKNETASNDHLGQYSLPLVCCQKGYRHIPLEDENGKSLKPSTLFIHFDFKDLERNDVVEHVSDRIRSHKQNTEKTHELGKFLS